MIQCDEKGTRVGGMAARQHLPSKVRWGPTLEGQANDVAIEELVPSADGIDWRPPKLRAA